MSGPVHLSRLTLKRTSELTPLINVLQPSDQSEAIEADHRLVWSAMPEDIQSARQRGGEAPFLWRRDDARGRYYVLGPQPRADSAFFHIESKPFDVQLFPGDRLQFVLRVNATVDRRQGGRHGKRKRSDVAMDLLHPVAQADRAGRRQQLAAQAAQAWLAARAASGGFTVDALHLDGYRAVPLRRRSGATGRIGVFDLRGLLTVREPETFVARVAHGFGRAKAFGCGLMLVRRAGSP